MICKICVDIMKENPKATPKQLFSTGKAGEVLCIYKGTGYCADHLPKEEVFNREII